jgi:XapX domain-containing protein
MKIAAGILLSLAVGILCRLLDLPLPAPLALTGAALVFSMSAGYEILDRLLPHAPATQAMNCGGPDGRTKAQRAEDGRRART